MSYLKYFIQFAKVVAYEYISNAFYLFFSALAQIILK